MPRSIWTGAISFGLVSVPVKLYSAVSRKTVRFHQLDGEGNVRIQQKRVNPVTGEEVPYDRLVKGYDLGDDRYVVITPAELETLDPAKTKTIEIEDFVELAAIDPIFFDTTYYLAPNTGGAKPYRLLLDAMEQSGRVGIARVVIRSKEALCALRPHGTPCAAARSGRLPGRAATGLSAAPATSLLPPQLHRNNCCAELLGAQLGCPAAEPTPRSYRSYRRSRCSACPSTYWPTMLPEATP